MTKIIAAAVQCSPVLYSCAGTVNKICDWIHNLSSDWGEYLNTKGHVGHHMGTTRIANNNKNGVVDKNLKVFSYDNLYISGSSVFPRFSYANPTLSIVMLSIRL